MVEAMTPKMIMELLVVSDTELWATVFEGLTHKTMNLEPLKEPEVFIEKRLQKDGQDKDSDSGMAT